MSVGAGIFSIAAILSGSATKPCMCEYVPQKLQTGLIELVFLSVQFHPGIVDCFYDYGRIFASNASMFSACTKMSSIDTSVFAHPRSSSVIASENTSGADDMPNGIRRQKYRPHGVANVRYWEVLLLTFNCQKPPRQTSLEKYLEPCTFAAISSSVFSGKWRLSMVLFSFVGSMHSLSFSPFRTTSIGLTAGVGSETGVMTPNLTILSSSLLTRSLIA